MIGNRPIFALAILLSAAGCSRTGVTNSGIATDEGIAAIALPEEQYRDLLKRTALGSQSGAMHLGMLGLEEGCAALDKAVDSAVDQHLPEWRANLVAAYRDNVPSNRLAEAVEESPRRARSTLQAYLPAISAAMKQRSEGLLQSSSVEVLQATGAAAAKVDRASVNLEDRQRDLAEMKTSGQICGVNRWQQ